MRKIREKRKGRKAAKEKEIEDTSDGRRFNRIIFYFVDLILTSGILFSKFKVEIQKLA